MLLRKKLFSFIKRYAIRIIRPLYTLNTFFNWWYLFFLVHWKWTHKKQTQNFVRPEIELKFKIGQKYSIHCCLLLYDDCLLLMELYKKFCLKIVELDVLLRMFLMVLYSMLQIIKNFYFEFYFPFLGANWHNLLVSSLNRLIFSFERLEMTVGSSLIDTSVNQSSFEEYRMHFFFELRIFFNQSTHLTHRDEFQSLCDLK